MKEAIAKLTKLSICPCGFTLLRDEIPLGTEYTVYPDSVEENRQFTLICGGCRGRVNGLGRILARSVLNPDARPMYLPLEIFDVLNDDIIEEK